MTAAKHHDARDQGRGLGALRGRDSRGEQTRGYEILGALAAGRTSMVYLARRGDDGGASPGPLVALKRLLPGHGPGSPAHNAFVREAALASRIRHPHVVGAHGLGADEGGPYYPMAYVEGASLLRVQTVDRDGRSVLTPVPASVAVRIALDVLAGLEAVHGATEPLVLGDLAPGNVLVGVSGRSQLTDFGCAGIAGKTPVSVGGSLDAAPGYSSPEWLRGEGRTVRSDLFGVGVLLWELFAGRRLFAAPSAVPSPALVARLVLAAPIPDLSLLVPSLNRRLVDVCGKALERDPAARFASAREMAESLAAAAAESYGLPGHDVVEAFIEQRCRTFLEQVRRMTERPDTNTKSGIQPRVR